MQPEHGQPQSQSVLLQQQPLPAMSEQATAVPTSCTCPPPPAPHPQPGGQQPPSQASNDTEVALQALQTAWTRAVTRLPGRRPVLLGAMPSVWVLLPGGARRAREAGALLVQVDQPPPTLPAPQQQLLLDADVGLAPGLRLLVYARGCGTLLKRLDWLPAHRHATEHQPHWGVPAWNSGDGWALLFPADQPHQAKLFSCLVAGFGLQADAAGSASSPVTPATHDCAQSSPDGGLQHLFQAPQHCGAHRQQPWTVPDAALPQPHSVPAAPSQRLAEPACSIKRQQSGPDLASSGTSALLPATKPQQPAGDAAARPPQVPCDNEPLPCHLLAAIQAGGPALETAHSSASWDPQGSGSARAAADRRGQAVPQPAGIANLVLDDDILELLDWGDSLPMEQA